MPAYFFSCLVEVTVIPDPAEGRNWLKEPSDMALDPAFTMDDGLVVSKRLCSFKYVGF